MLDFNNYVAINSLFLQITDHEKALEMGQMLIDKHFGHNVKDDKEIFKDDDTYYRLLEDDDSSALNAGELSECAPQPGLSWVYNQTKYMVSLGCRRVAGTFCIRNQSYNLTMVSTVFLWLQR